MAIPNGKGISSFNKSGSYKTKVSDRKTIIITTTTTGKYHYASLTERHPKLVLGGSSNLLLVMIKGKESA